MAPFSEKLLRKCVCKHLSCASDSMELTKITTGKFNTSYFVNNPDSSYVLRIAPSDTAVQLFYERDMMYREPETHRILIQQTPVPVAQIIAFDNSHDIIPHNYELMERLPGVALSDRIPPDYSLVLYNIGVSLAQVHSITSGQYGYLGSHAPMKPQSSWADAFSVMWEMLIDDIAAVGMYNLHEAKKVVQLLNRNIHHFDRPVPASLLHMDIWSQNILIDTDGTLSGIVDWDRALWGDPEIEYAVLDYCGISELSFWKGYRKQRDQSESATIRRIFYLLYEIQKYIVIEQGRRNNYQKALSYKKQSFQLMQQLV